MTQDRHRQELDVIGQHIEASPERSQRLSRTHQAESPSGACAEAEGRSAAGRSHDIGDVFLHRRRETNSLSHMLQLSNLFGIRHGLQGQQRVFLLKTFQDGNLFLSLRIPQSYLEEKPIELCFG